MPKSRKELVFFILGGFFLTNAILGELTGGKLFQISHSWDWLGIGGVILPIGLIPWPVVFITTDLVNEYYGRAGVRQLTFLAVGMITYAFLLLFAAIAVPAWEHSPVSGEAFRAVFGQSQWIIVGSLIAFVVSQLTDIYLFSLIKSRTGKRMLWLRATGSTFISQFVDTFIVQYIAFVVPGKITFQAAVPIMVGSYTFKVLVAIGITPLIYAVHGIIDAFLEREESIPLS